MKKPPAKKPATAPKGNKDTNPIEFYSYIQEGKFIPLITH